MQTQFYKLQTKHIRLNQILSKKAEKIKSLQREKLGIQKKYDKLLRAYRGLTEKQTEESVGFID